ncbi:MAG: tRNA (adenosine(37)-N6)-threonylcarbamoyltransferase complex ATPase subunit type 1 TsaE [bacterium]
MTFTCQTVNDLSAAAKQLLSGYPASRVFAFYGQMGAGKTTFIKAICRQLGANEIVQSPSFAIINEYTTHSEESLYHFDFYRIKRAEEAFDIGYEEYIYSGSYCFLEWPELIEQLLPADVIKVTIAVEPDGCRKIEF